MSHWYETTGAPMYEIEGANGNIRPTTLRDARKLNLCPSVTTVLQIIDKPQLTKWKVNQVMLAALTLPKVDGETLDEFAIRIRQDAEEQAIEARNVGSEIHDDIEMIWTGFKPVHHSEIAYAVVESIANKYPDEDFIAEAYVSGDGYGGRCDLHSENVCIDYKGKDITDEQWTKYQKFLAWNGKGRKPAMPKLAYDEHNMQLAAYAKSLCKPNPKLVNVFFDRKIAGRVIIIEHEKNMFSKFQAALNLWQEMKEYKPEID